MEAGELGIFYTNNILGYMFVNPLTSICMKWFTGPGFLTPSLPSACPTLCPHISRQAFINIKLCDHSKLLPSLMILMGVSVLFALQSKYLSVHHLLKSSM